MLFYTIILPIGLLLLFFTFFIVKQQTSAIIERFGKFVSVRQSGLQLKIPIIDNVAGRLSLRIQQLDVVVETKTKDDVFVRLKVSVQFKVIKEKVYDAFYKLDNPGDQITSSNEADGTGLTSHYWMLWVARPPISSDCRVIPQRLFRLDRA